MVREGGPCMARLGNGDNAPLCCHEGLSSTWYGKSGHQFCGSHRAAWNRWKKEHGVEQEEEEPRYLTEMDELLGTRYCEPAEMKTDERFNDVTKSSLQFCVQGTFTAESYTRGMVDTRWQTLEQLSESCSREDFERLFKRHLKDLEKTFKRDAKRFKKAAELEEE
jgi:hypothetical protein